MIASPPKNQSETESRLWQYKWARWYDSQAGRWISEDPLGFAAGDANLARYVKGQPLVFRDGSGLIDGAMMVGVDLDRHIRDPYELPIVANTPWGVVRHFGIPIHRGSDPRGSVGPGGRGGVDFIYLPNAQAVRDADIRGGIFVHELTAWIRGHFGFGGDSFAGTQNLSLINEFAYIASANPDLLTSSYISGRMEFTVGEVHLERLEELVQFLRDYELGNLAPGDEFTHNWIHAGTFRLFDRESVEFATELRIDAAGELVGEFTIEFRD